MYANGSAETMFPALRVDKHDGQLILPDKAAQDWLQGALSAALGYTTRHKREVPVIMQVRSMAGPVPAGC